MSGNPFILIADDDQFFSTLLKVKFEEEGLVAQVANNGEEAMKMIRAKRPDLLVLDIVMPVKDGFEVIKEIKEDDKLKTLKIVVLTNLAQEEDKKSVLQMGVQDFIVKSDVSIADLAKKIKEILS